MEAWGYSCDVETLSETRVWGSTPENTHCFSATAPLRIELRWGCEESSGITAVGSGDSFKYDPLGKRIYKSSVQGTTIFVYDEDNLVEAVNSSGAVTARYTQGLNVDEVLVELNSTPSFFETDGLGSVTSLTSSSAALAVTYSYDSFGRLTNSSGSVQNSSRYTARDFDAETGLYYYRARYYDVTTGRFISEDPLAFIASENFYNYANSNSTNLVDPTGLYSYWDIPLFAAHYCSGPPLPFTTPFSSINWGNTQNKIKQKVKALAAGSCTERSVPVVNDIEHAQTEGADRYIIGRHDVKVNGTIQVHCDCTWTFHGDMSSAVGYDVYDFPPEDRQFAPEAQTWFGRHMCIRKGMPFRIYLPGSMSVSAGGTIDDQPTCPCGK